MHKAAQFKIMRAKPDGPLRANMEELPALFRRIASEIEYLPGEQKPPPSLK